MVKYLKDKPTDWCYVSIEIKKKKTPITGVVSANHGRRIKKDFEDLIKDHKGLQKLLDNIEIYYVHNE